MVQVQRVPQSRSIQVFGYTKPTQGLRAYFESDKFSGGTRIERMEEVQGKFVVVTFKDRDGKYSL